MPNLLLRTFRIGFTVACFFCLRGIASAQLAFVPRQVNVVAGTCGNYGGADTAFSAGTRGLGQFYQGQGQYLWGAGKYLQAVGQYHRDYQTAYGLAVLNHYQRIALKREWERQLECDRQAHLAAARAKNERRRSASQTQATTPASQPSRSSASSTEAVDSGDCKVRHAEAHRQWLSSPLCRAIEQSLSTAPLAK